MKNICSFDTQDRVSIALHGVSINVTPSVPNYKSFQKSWRVKAFSRY